MGEFLAGKELEGKIGEVGSYEVDVDAKGHVSAKVGVAFDKELIPGVTAKLSVDGAFTVKIATLAAAQAAKSDNKLLKLIAGALAKIDAGDEIHADVQAALEQHVSPVG